MQPLVYIQSSSNSSNELQNAFEFGDSQTSFDVHDYDANLDDDSGLMEDSVQLLTVRHSAFEDEVVMPDRYSQPTSVTVAPYGTIAMDKVKADLCIKELEEFQMQTISAISHGNDVILVQPTGSGKSLCFIVPGLLNPSKVCVVIEPLVAIINNQVEALQRKGIDAVALGGAVGNMRSKNYHRVFKSSASNIPKLAFSTPEYLFGCLQLMPHLVLLANFIY